MNAIKRSLLIIILLTSSMSCGRYGRALNPEVGTPSPPPPQQNENGPPVSFSTQINDTTLITGTICAGGEFVQILGVTHTCQTGQYIIGINGVQLFGSLQQVPSENSNQVFDINPIEPATENQVNTLETVQVIVDPTGVTTVVEI